MIVHLLNQIWKRQLNCIKYFFFGLTILTVACFTIEKLPAQNVLVTDDSTYVPKASAILDIKTTNKGMLMPRVNLTSTASASPITSPDSSLLVYNKATAGDVTPGYYYWNGSKWVRLANGQGQMNMVTKTANATLLKTETMVLASNNITLTLPVVTSADNGLEITIKNIGIYTDLVEVKGSGSATVDNYVDNDLYRWNSQTYVAYNGNWLLKFSMNKPDNIFEVDSNGSWESVAEVMAYLNMHMEEPSVVSFCGGSFPISATVVVNLPYPVSFIGSSYGETYIDGAAGVSGNPMFNCQTECYFKMLTFSAYSNAAGNDAIRFTVSGNYHEVKDCSFDGFNKGIVSTNNNDLWVFDSDFENCTYAGIEIAAGGASGGSFKISECDFTNCARGINLKSGVAETISIMNTTFYNTVAGTDIGVLYTPATFTSYAFISITNSSWNNQGTFISGFDFTRTDGRDANAYLQSNAGMGDNNPKCKINVANNASVTTCTNSLTYYKAVWTNTSSIPCKFTVNNNKITYQSANRKNAFAIITGNLQVNSSTPVITLALIKNGVTGTPYGETNIKITAANQPFQFATVIYLDNIGPTDYFELYCYSSNSGNQVTFSDVQWYTECK